MKEIQLKVSGMHCKSCEMLISDELEDTKAVEDILVSFEKGIVSLKYNQNKISLEKIKDIIKEEGYSVA